MTSAFASARAILKALLARAVRRRDIDLRMAKWRLQELGARHAELSAVLSADDTHGQPSRRLLELSSTLIAQASQTQLSSVRERGAPEWIDVWPGEHYRLLRTLIDLIQPLLTIEIGTFSGLSALAMLSGLQPGQRLVTFDIVPWQEMRGTYLRDSDFTDGRLSQELGDLGDPETFQRHAELLSRADMIFVDGPKDGMFEQRLLDNLAHLSLRPQVLIVFDDVRLWNMLPIWRRMERPKIDITSFGHFTGTGLIDWNGMSDPQCAVMRS